MRSCGWPWLAAAIAVACAPAPESPSPTAPTARNVVLIVVDSLRADRLQVHGAKRPIMPNVDSLAREGAAFLRAYATSPWTQPSVCSLFTGLHPSSHGVTRYGRMMPDELDTLTERLQENGYRTAGVVSHTLVSQRFQFAQGFELFDQTQAQGHRHVSTSGVTEAALDYLDTLAADGRPFFLYAHYFDPHYQYRDHEEIDHAPEGAGRLTGRRGIGKLRELLDTMTPEEIAFLEALYDEEATLTDAGIGRLLARLDELGVAEETLVIFTADHGEEFLAHGWLGHTRTLYDELVRVPFLVRGPGVAPGSRIESPVSHVSLPNTVLDLLALDAVPRLPGGSMLGELRGLPAPPAAPVFCEVDFVDSERPEKNVHKKSIATKRWKCIRDERTGRVALYDLIEDPDELVDVSDAHPDVAIGLIAELEQHLASLAGKESRRVGTKLSEEELLELSRLGYTEVEQDDG